MPASRPAATPPRIAAAIAFAGLLAACQSAGTISELPAAACDGEPTPIAAVQGEGMRSDLQNQKLSVRGVVTWIENGAGVFLQEPASDLSAASSDGIFVSSPELSSRVAQGDQIVASGTVAEIGSADDTMTSLDAVYGYRICANGIPLPVSDARLPLSREDKEALEGMNILMRQSLAVTDVYGLRDGEMRLSMNRILPFPTEVARPGPDARKQSRKNRDRSISVALDSNDRQPYSVGTVVMAATGVLGHDGSGPRLLLREPLTSMPLTIFATRPPAGDEIRVVGLNLHNYFNGDGGGGGFPTTRGAQSAQAFDEQRARLAEQFGQIRADILGVMELENDGFGPRSAAQDLVRDLQGMGQGNWNFVSPGQGPIGGDEITVGIFYRQDRVAPTGAAQVLSGPPFEGQSRRPLAQWFKHRDSGEVFLVVVNHFKSKGSCPEDGRNANRLDGQGCWNPARVDSARRMTDWVNRLMRPAGRGKALILGDLNAYRMEDPVRAIVSSGFADLTASTGLQPEYSFVYRGEAGTLDYAFASDELVPHVRSARFLNINAAYPAGVRLQHPWLRASDHDPVVVDLRFRQAETSD